MNKNESFRDYFQRAKRDPAARAALLKNAQVSRSVFGWISILFAAAALTESALNGIQSGVWLPGAAIFSSFGFVGNLLVWAKFGDRIAALRVMNEADEAPQ